MNLGNSIFDCRFDRCLKPPLVRLHNMTLLTQMLLHGIHIVVSDGGLISLHRITDARIYFVEFRRHP